MAVYAVHNQNPKFIFIINYKVMYSSLVLILPKHFPEVKFYRKDQVAKFKFSSYPKYSVVRNPYNRAVSAFFGTCRKAPHYALQREKARLQYSQSQLLHSLKKVRGQDFEIVRPANLYSSTENPQERKTLNANYELLKTISFEEFTICLQIILDKEHTDGHFEKQYKSFSIPNQNQFFFRSMVFKKTKIIKLENINQDWEIICAELGKEMPLIKMNVTDHMHGSPEEIYTDKTLQFIAEAYKIDFNKFNYSFDL